MAGAIDVEALFDDVGLVQKELERFNVKQPIDANEIYERLETHWQRADRVQFVTSQLLYMRGLRQSFDGFDVINLSDDSDGYLEDAGYTTSPEYNIPSDSVLDLSLSDTQTTEHSFFNGNGDENIGNNMDSSKHSPILYDGRADMLTDVCKTEDDVIPLDCTVESSQTCMKVDETLEHNDDNALSPSNYLIDNFLCDVNNNDPNNNTDYEVPQQAEETHEQNSEVVEVDDFRTEFQDQDDVRCKLLDEARLIHRIVPRQNLEQIYSYLEANLDLKNRVQIVMQEFLTMEFSQGVSEETVKLNGCMSSSSKDESHYNLQEASISSEKEVEIIGNNVGSKILNEPQPSTSVTHEELLMKAKDVSKKDDVILISIPELENFKCGGTEKIVEKSGTDYKSLIEVDMKDSNTVEVSSTSTSSKSAVEGPKGYSVICNAAEVITSTTNTKNPPIDKQIPVCLPNFESLPSTSKTVPYVPIVLPSTSTGERMKRKSESVDDAVSPSKKNKNNLDNLSENLLNVPEGSTEIILTKDQQKYRSILMEMFPNADPQYLKQQCKCVETEELFYALISRMLEGDNYPLRQVPVEEPNEQPGPSVAVSSEDVINAQHQILLAILPDADPTYLLKTCEEISNDENAMKTFVANALEKKDYPKLAEYNKRQEALALQKKYTENFSIEGFLEILPEPFKYFLEEKKNIAKGTEHAMAYLKGRYKKIRNEDLKRIFKRYGYNLTLTCQELDSFIGPVRRNRRSEYECRVPTQVNIPFIQEVAFIENKKMIEDYLKEKSENKKKAFEKAKAKGELLTCGCCFDDEVMAEDMAACNEGHLFCKDCVKKGAEVQIGNGKTTFPCLDDCEAEFSLKTLQTVLKPAVLSKMLQRKQLEEVKAAGIEDLETCPFCDFATIPPREDKVFRCLNAECMRESCRNCKEPNHIPLRCDEVEKSEEVKMRTFIEDRMTEALVRTCWQCGKKFIKESGCNKMRCTCGALMCYICRKPVKDYTHFNGQGGEEFHKCPLYTNNDAVHVDAVREEAEKAKQEIESKNPEIKLKHDPTKVLPQAGQNDPARYFFGANPGNAGFHFVNLLPPGRDGVEVAIRLAVAGLNVNVNNRGHHRQHHQLVQPPPLAPVQPPPPPPPPAHHQVIAHFRAPPAHVQIPARVQAATRAITVRVPAHARTIIPLHIPAQPVVQLAQANNALVNVPRRRARARRVLNQQMQQAPVPPAQPGLPPAPVTPTP